QDSAIHLLRRRDSENMQNGGGEIDVSRGQFISFATPNVGSGGDEKVVHIETAERNVSPLARRSLPVCIDHSRNAELIFRVVPAKSHHHIWRRIALNSCLIQPEGSLDRFSAKDHAGKICSLQKFHQAARYRRIGPS